MTYTMHNGVRCATTEDGNIEAAIWHMANHTTHYVICDPRTGDVIKSTEEVGTPMFRTLVVAARKHCAR